MIIYENVETLDKNELKEITFENTSYTASVVAHIIKINRIATALTAEVNKHKDIIKAHENELKGNKLVTVEHKDSPHFSKDDFIAVYGEKEYERFVRITDAKTVKFNG